MLCPTKREKPLSCVRQFQVACAEQVDLTLVQDQVRTVLEDTIVGFDIANDLKVMGISLPPEKLKLRDI